MTRILPQVSERIRLLLGKNRLISFLVASFFLHILFLAGTYVRSQMVERKPQYIQQRVKINFVPKLKTSKSGPGEEKPLPRKKQQGRMREPGKHPAQKKIAYKTLFPTLAEAAKGFSLQQQGSDEATEGRATHYVHQGDLQQFLSELLANLEIPEGMWPLALNQTAKVRIHLNQRRGTAAILSARGDSYLRALVYERINEILSESIAKEYLLKTTFNTIVINVRLKNIVTMQPKPRETKTSIQGNSIYITFENYKIDDRWYWLTAGQGSEGEAQVGINVLAPLFVVYQKFIADNPEKADPSLKELRGSAAYTRDLNLARP